MGSAKPWPCGRLRRIMTFQNVDQPIHDDVHCDQDLRACQMIPRAKILRTTAPGQGRPDCTPYVDNAYKRPFNCPYPAHVRHSKGEVMRTEAGRRRSHPRKQTISIPGYVHGLRVRCAALTRVVLTFRPRASQLKKMDFLIFASTFGP